MQRRPDSWFPTCPGVSGPMDFPPLGQPHLLQERPVWSPLPDEKFIRQPTPRSTSVCSSLRGMSSKPLVQEGERSWPTEPGPAQKERR